ncbi:MAG TPA: TolC family outer membrane protein [Burkholderiales bacterium]|jgi:outer membrane protein|nr:TolC family outer membrane protein [Burkholderiales bacterium]
MKRVASCLMLLAVAASTPAADLGDLYRLARDSDAAYASARASWAAAQEKLPQGRAGLLPAANLSAFTQYNDREIRFRDPSTPVAASKFNSNALTLSLTQPLYRRQNWIAFEQAKTQVLQADAQFALAAQDLILRVAQAYFDVLLAQDTVAFAEAQKAAIGEQLAQAKRNFEVGTATITDQHDAQARYDLTVAQEIAARNDLEIKRRQLAQVIGRAAPPLAPVGKALPLTSPEPNRIDTWVQQATTSSIQVIINEAALTFAQQEVERNRGGHHPTLDAFASYSDSSSGSGLQGGFGNDSNTKIVGLQLALPLYQGGATASRVREALANEEKARQDLENARRSAELAARQGFLGVTSGVAQVHALQAALVSSQSSLDSTRLGLEVGVRTQVDVLNAQQQLFSTRRDLAQARYNYILSLLRLKAAVGTLTEDDIVKVNAWLERK